MEFKNPEIREGINVSNEHPLIGLAQLVLSVIAVIAIIMVVIHYSVQYLVHYIPFEFEVEMSEKIDFLQAGDPLLYGEDEGLEKQAELQTLANELSALMELPEEMTITVHYSNEQVVNAFATLGGHVFMYQGLIDEMNSEQALSMVMAHEIAHIKLRHPISSLGEGVTLMALAAVITGATGSNAGESLINSSTNLGLMKFSRDQEQHSDLLAAHVVQAKYGNILGAKDLFKTFQELDGTKSDVHNFFLSHPNSDKRWNDLLDKAAVSNLSVEGELTPIPTILLDVTEDDSEKADLDYVE